MRTRYYVLIIMALALFAGTANAQIFDRTLQAFRYNDKRGLNVFEPDMLDTVPFTGVKVVVGGDFAFQFQAINQSNTLDNLVELGSNFNLPTANLNLDVQLYDGVRMHLRTYLSARHHEESWVKGGYLQIDKLDFIKPDFAAGLMDFTRVTIGLDEINYGDAHFRRTDNARAIFNPFVGNYIMDAFTTEAFGEITLMPGSFITVIGVSNGKLNQNVIVNDDSDNKISFYGKIGIDKQMNEDLRLRLTGSWYTNNGETTGNSLYGGDRAGSRYYGVMHTLEDGGSDFEGRFNPRFNQLTSYQINPFIQFGGLEFFGIYEIANNSEDLGDGQYTQVAAELLYRFGGSRQFYFGGRYNTVNGEQNDGDPEIEIIRTNIGGGWFMTKNIITKIEYVNQKYDGDGYDGTKFQGAEFDGIVIEAAISF
jgi:hypothetical protein